MKPILQSEAAECGLACLAMVASHYGKHVGLQALRQQHALSLKGMSLGRLIAAADQIDLQGRALRIDVEQMQALKLPCILHWDMSHFVVLERVRSDSVDVLDPAFGRRRLGFAEVSEHFTGVALELMPGLAFARQAPPPAIRLRELTGPIGGLRRALLTVLILSAALQVFVLLSPFFLQWVVDQVLVGADRDLLALLGLAFTLLLLLQVATNALRTFAIIQLSASLSRQWVVNVFAHLLKLPLEFFEKRHLGDVVSRLGSVKSIQTTLTTSFVEAVIDGAMAIVTFSAMLFYSPKLALVSVVAVASYLCVRWLSFARLRAGTEAQMVAGADQQSYLLESVRGVQTLKLAGAESQRAARFANLNAESVNHDVRLARLSLGFVSVNQLMFGCERLAVIWLGSWLTLNGVFSVGMLVAYLAYREQFSQRVIGLIDKSVEFRMLRLHGERLAEIVLAQTEREPDTAPPEAEPLRGSISVRNLCFRYGEDEPWLLHDCSFSIEPGESVAIVGASGCGKTTLLKLMLGLLKPDSGSIEVDGVPLARLGARRFRSAVGAVMQDDQLFAGSVADNIAFCEGAPDLDRVERAARLAAVHDDIRAMPMGYYSLIGDMGTTLSGGQKQRVILARALYREPALLVLDEATSHLDTERERLVNEAVKALCVTKIIIAHRPETIASAGRVLRLDQGGIREVRARAEQRRTASVRAIDGAFAAEAVSA